MSLVLQGFSVGGGIAIGRAHLVRQSMDDVVHLQLEDDAIEQEIKRFEEAIKLTRKQLEKLRISIPENAPTELGAFISLHLMLLTDVTISREPIDLIEEEHCNAEWALKIQVENLSQQFDDIEDEYLRERKQDMLQVVERIFKNLAGQNPEVGMSVDLFDETILVAHDLSPADMVYFKDNRIAAFTTDVGGLTSHTAILGKSLDLPSVIALNNGRDLIREDDWLIIDGIDGVVIVQPDDIVLTEYRQRAREYKAGLKKLEKIKKVAAQTLEGIPVDLLANIESPDDIEDVLKTGADGVGLFRSEFLFLNRDTFPTEEEQYQVYTQTIKSLKTKQLTVRTIDLGVDKNPRWFHHDQGLNPALGLTGIRLCLAEPILFRTQLRALLRASVHGDIQIMFPMISSIVELNQALSHLEIVKDQLKEEKIPFNVKIKIGTMIEIPSAALTVTSILKKVDFISIGTNDLIQYTLAVDRANTAVAHLYQSTHPAILKLVSHIIKSANKLEKPVAICGEMAGDIKLTRLLLAMGLRRFSMHPANLLAIKQRICETKLIDIEPISVKVFRTEDPDRVEELVTKMNSL
ncbi:phosphoenolpyruvate--protein phosphotransferase [Neisseria sp. Ec49-e6-T10]|uniref:phosphoenolpyruvate--protein phosphotransferase n=1 Tax=Neisseria sp. Ec49-e6-T10 TaxID=3140744 RepID=UPI003EBD22C7